MLIRIRKESENSRYEIDNNLLKNAMIKGNIEHKKLKKVNQKKTSDISTNDILFEIQKNMILDLTKDNMSHIVTLPFLDKIQQEQQLDPDKYATAALIQKTNQQNKYHYNYDLCINSSILGMDNKKHYL